MPPLKARKKWLMVLSSVFRLQSLSRGVNIFGVKEGGCCKCSFGKPISPSWPLLHPLLVSADRVGTELFNGSVIVQLLL